METVVEQKSRGPSATAGRDKKVRSAKGTNTGTDAGTVSTTGTGTATTTGTSRNTFGSAVLQAHAVKTAAAIWTQKRSVTVAALATPAGGVARAPEGPTGGPFRRQSRIPGEQEGRMPAAVVQALRRGSVVPVQALRRGSVVPAPGEIGRSYWFRRPSMAGSHRLTDRSGEGTQKSIQYENTYQLEPGEKNTMNEKKVQQMLEQVLQSYLDGEQYDARKCVGMASQLSDVIKQRVKDMKMARNKVVCCVLIGQNAGQSFRLGSRCLWNPATDNYTSAEYKNNSLFAVATVHIVYCE